MLRDERETENGHIQAEDKGRNGSLHPRLAWMLFYDETRSVQEVCKRFGISRKTFYKWLKRYKQSSGDSGSLMDQSRRPHRFPRATPASSVLLLKQVKDQTGYGQRRLKIYMQEKYNINLSERTIWKILKRMNEAESLSHIGSSDQHSVIFSNRM
jgi:transposase